MAENYLKVENESGLVRDSRSGAILNTDRESLDLYRRARGNRIRAEARFIALENDMAELKNKLNTILELIGKQNG